MIRWLTSHPVRPSSSTMIVTTGTSTLVLKLTSNLAGSFSIPLRFLNAADRNVRAPGGYGGQVLDAEREIEFQFARFRHRDLLRLAGQPFMPGLELVHPRRDVGQSVAAFVVGGREVRVLQHQDDATHASVNRAKNIYPA